MKLKPRNKIGKWVVIKRLQDRNKSAIYHVKCSGWDNNPCGVEMESNLQNIKLTANKPCRHYSKRKIKKHWWLTRVLISLLKRFNT